MSTSQKSKRTGSAAQRFRDAFERLKRNEPIVLPKGTAVSQNNVAKEASCDPSALRKGRFPLLIIEIQTWLAENKTELLNSPRKKILKQRQKNRDAKTHILELKQQRDSAQSYLNDANLRIMELTDEIKTLRAALDEYRPSAKIFKTSSKSILGMDKD